MDIGIGILIGVVLSMGSFYIMGWVWKTFGNTMQRTLRQNISASMPKGRVIEPDPPDLEEWIDTLPSEIQVK